MACCFEGTAGNTGFVGVSGLGRNTGFGTFGDSASVRERAGVDNDVWRTGFGGGAGLLLIEVARGLGDGGLDCGPSWLGGNGVVEMGVVVLEEPLPFATSPMPGITRVVGGGVPEGGGAGFWETGGFGGAVVGGTPRFFFCGGGGGSPAELFASSPAFEGGGFDNFSCLPGFFSFVSEASNAKGEIVEIIVKEGWGVALHSGLKSNLSWAL